MSFTVDQSRSKPSQRFAPRSRHTTYPESEAKNISPFDCQFFAEQTPSPPLSYMRTHVFFLFLLSTSLPFDLTDSFANILLNCHKLRCNRRVGMVEIEYSTIVAYR